MRFKKPMQNSERIIKRFLLFPRTIEHEVRWLEYASIKQRYDEYRGKWVDSMWID